MAASKHSKQRGAILEVLSSTKTHPTADWIFTELKKIYPCIGLATVYRNLKLFEEQGLLIKIDVGDGVDHFDADTSEHSHFFCRLCGRVSDIEVPSLEVDSFLPDGYCCERQQLVLFGRCNDCMKEQCS